MTEHWNFALEHSNGKYITFLGDDDAFIPSELIKLAGRLAETESDIVVYPRATYEWPNGSSPGNFYQEVRKYRETSLEVQRRRVLNFDYRFLPIPYHFALVNRRIMELAKERSPGKDFFSTRNPDYNAGAKILFLSATEIYYPRTVFISGASSTSNGGLNSSNPRHPRAQEYRDMTLNPPANWMPNLELPNGFIWLYEAVEDVIRDLGINSDQRGLKALFLSVYRSHDPIKQLVVSRQIWPSKILIGEVAVVLGLLRLVLIRLHFLSLLRYCLIMFRVGMGLSSVRSIKGQRIMKDTSALVSFLESSKALESQNRLLMIRL
jgi:glycosyltransferase involved in cell wall biosynthesis